MNTLSWYNFDDTSADGFKIYWSLPGFVLPFSALTFGSVLKFSATSPDVQQITIDSSSVDAAVSSINAQAKGVYARKSQDQTKILIRLAATGPKARLKLYACPALTAAGIAAQTIVPGLYYSMIHDEPFATGTAPYAFEHSDGDPKDSYRLTSYAGVVESLPTVEQSPLVPGVSFCVVEARFVNPQGRPVIGVEVEAAPALTGPHYQTAANSVKVVTDAYGRISLPLVQCQQYILRAPSVGYNQFIDVPEINFLDLATHPATTAPEFSPLGDVP